MDKKLCDISALYYPHGGGIKTYIDNKRLIYQQRNIQHILLAPNVVNTDKLEKIEDGCLTLYYLPSKKVSLTGTPYYIFKSFADILEVLKTEQPSVVEIGDKMTTLFFGGKLKNLNRHFPVKTFAFSHERADNFSQTVFGNKLIGSALASLVMKRFVKAADYLIANSEFTSQELTKHVSPDRIFIVKLGINADNLVRADYFDQQLHHQLSQGGTKFLLVHVGRLDKDKKIQLLVKFAKQLDATRFKLVVVGGGSFEQYIKDLDSVYFAGYRQYEDVKKFLAVCDLGVLVNNIEPYGLVGLEMMAFGLPILGPNQGGLPSFMKASFAWLLPYDEASYLKALEEWYSLPQVAKDRKSQAARAESEKYSLDYMVDQILDIYNQHA